jgi:hypothetical protein
LTQGAPGTSRGANEEAEPLTIVELAPGKSVEIEARTRLSLRLSPESGTTPRVTPPRARKAVRKPRPAPSASQPTKPEPPPAEAPPSNGLINPWPAPAKD